MKIRVYNRSCEKDYFEPRKFFWWDPFWSNSKFEIIFEYDDKKNVDIIYENIFVYSDYPWQAYQNKNKCLVPQPIYNKEINKMFNVKTVPMVYYSLDDIRVPINYVKIKHDPIFYKKLRGNKKIYDFIFEGNLHREHNLNKIKDWCKFDGIIRVYHTRTSWSLTVPEEDPNKVVILDYSVDDFLEVNRTSLEKLDLNNYYFRENFDLIWHKDKKIANSMVNFYLERLSKSKFAFCPRGAGSSSIRLYESLSVGTIPIITGMKEYPFDDEYNWDSFSLRTDSIKNLQYLIDQAQNLSDKDIKEMRQNGMKFWEKKCRPDVFNDWVIETYLLN